MNNKSKNKGHLKIFKYFFLFFLFSFFIILFLKPNYDIHILKTFHNKILY